MILKTRVKDAAAALASLLPLGVRQSMFEALLSNHIMPSDERYDVMSRIAASCNVNAFVVQGEEGLIRGSSQDRSVLRHYATHGYWASRTTRLFKDFYSRVTSGTYIDVGANIGLTLIPIARLAAVRCIGVEAEPRNFSYLEENVTTAAVGDRVVLRNVAVFSKPAKVQLELAGSNLGDHRIRVDESQLTLQGEHLRDVVTVEALPLDEIIAGIDPTFSCLNDNVAVKVDVQGAEPFVFEGGQKTLASARILVTEFSPYFMARMNADPEAVLGSLDTHFSHVRLANQEDEPPSAPMPVREATKWLRKFASDNATDAHAYIDIIAEKNCD
jgi:FkbM family methyltransferase